MKTLQKVAAATAAAIATSTLFLAPVAAAAPSAPPPPAADPSAAAKATVLRLEQLPYDRSDLACLPVLVSPTLKQHDARIADGVTGLRTWISGYRSAHPSATISIKRVIADGNLVMIHANVVETPGTRGDAVADIYRLDHGRVAEHWHLAQAVPATTVTGNDMFSTLSPPQNRPAPDPTVPTPPTKAIAQDMLTRGIIPVEDEIGLDPYYQHNPNLPNGLAVVRGFLQQFPNLSIRTVQSLAQNDYIVFHSDYTFDPSIPHQDVMDMWRVVGGKIVEHWDVVQPLPTSSANGNGPF